MKEPQCPAQDVNGEGSASSTTGTSQESGQTEHSAGKPLIVLKMPQGSTQAQAEAVAKYAKGLAAELGAVPVVVGDGLEVEYHQPPDIADKLDQLIDLQREGNSLLLALIEALGEDPDPEELHIPRPL